MRCTCFTNRELIPMRTVVFALVLLVRGWAPCQSVANRHFAGTHLGHRSAFVERSMCRNRTIDNPDTCIAHEDRSAFMSCEMNSEASLQASPPAPIDAPDALGSDIGEPQVMDVSKRAEIERIIEEARLYIHHTVMTDETYNKVRDTCRNTNAQCAFWASVGECETNPAYMKLQCAPVCRSCDMLHVETRCPLDPNASDALLPGELNQLFERIVTQPEYQQYEPVVLSRPDYAAGDGPENATYSVGEIWVVQFNAALSSHEAERLIALGSSQGYERSADVGAEKADGTFESSINSGRTSTNAWCTGDCYTDPIAQTVMQRIANITGIPEANSENLQMLKYETDQFYKTHNDFIEYQVDRPCGARILTFYFYLNDVELGGGTDFPHLGLTVTPQKGRTVLWPSILDGSPNTKDPRSDHQALPVLSGIKYGANAWIHQRDFKSSNALGCA